MNRAQIKELNKLILTAETLELQINKLIMEAKQNDTLHITVHASQPLQLASVPVTKVIDMLELELNVVLDTLIIKGVRNG